MLVELEKYKAGHIEKMSDYSYLVPSPINVRWTWKTPEINDLLEISAIKLGALNSFARFVPNVNLFIHWHVAREAVVSSRIEGTQTEMDEAMLPEEEIKPERINDWKEVNNYIIALNEAIKKLEFLPISSRLLKEAHKTLLSGVRGEDKSPGEYRKRQNWIGGNDLKEAVFIPPHSMYINDLMGDLENFLHNKRISVPKLIRIAIAHYQFETIHPFLDGNGRIGRLLIPLYLVSEKVLDQPLLYLSSYFEKNKNLYYDNLDRVRTHNDMARWLKYFLMGIEQTSTHAINTLSRILALKDKMEKEVQSGFGRRASNALILLNHLFEKEKPFISVDNAAKACSLSYKSANDLIGEMRQKGYLKEVTGQGRNRLFFLQPYLEAFKNG